MQRDVLRCEKKYLLNLVEKVRTEAYLDRLLIQDPHNGAGGYRVRSLYFDTVFDKDFFDKKDGLETRRKVRLRIYDPLDEQVLLEIKQKQGENQRKRSLVLSRSHAERIIAGDFTPLLEYKGDFAAECYAIMETGCYRPKTIVEYDRKAYIAKENRTRITFDSGIRATESSKDFFDPHLVLNPVIDEHSAVMEVKYNGFLLSYIKQLLDCTDKTPVSVSKYLLARQQGYGTQL